MENKFAINESVVFEGKLGKIVNIEGVDINGETLYLVQLCNHTYRCIPEKNLEAYI
jgi:hypothetical protein